MINQISSSGVHAADIASLRNSRSKKSSTQATGQPDKTPRPERNAPPGLARAAEKIASKIVSRADSDASGTVTQEELSAVHSKHARNLASSDLFQHTEPTTEDSTTATTPSSETPEAPQTASTASQLKEALTKFFYAKVSVTYIPPITEPPALAEPTAPTPPTVDTTVLEEPASQSFIAMA